MTTSESVAPSPADDTSWILRGHRATPAEALPRIATLCQSLPDLFTALFVTLATHQGLPRDVLALAIKQYRPDLADLSRDDVVSLLVSIINGGKPGFEAVLRGRRKADRKAAAAMWVKDD